ncbi:MAG: transposase domain-containing protein, partial [Phycisphaerae bacterium]
MSVIVHGGTIDSQKIVAVPTPKDRQFLEALARHIPPAMVQQVLERTGRSSCRLRRLPAFSVVWLVIAIGLW